MPYIENTYVLDPDLAVPYVVKESDKDKYGPVYDIRYRTVAGTLNAFDIRTPDQKHFSESNMTKMILNSFKESITEAMELVRWGMPTQQYSVPYYCVRKMIDSIKWNLLPSLSKQYYIPLTDTYDERHRYGQDYAGLKTPQRGTVSELTYDETDGTITVRGQKSKVIAGTTRFLLRLRDGSLLELYEPEFDFKQNIKSLEYAMLGLTRLLQLEPNLMKTYYLAFMLDNYLGRPAYRMSNVIQKGLFDI